MADPAAQWGTGMFETAEIGHRIERTIFDQVVPKLRAALLDAQYRLKEDGKFPVIVLISGVRGAGKGETVNLLNEWMDPRHIVTHAFDNPSDEERERPRMWRYWRALPPRGKIGILFGSWYTAPITDRVFRNTKRGDLVQSIAEINRFERMLADEGALILKFWFHLSKVAQRRRLKALEADPETRWRVSERDWDFFKLYDRFYKISEMTLRETSRADAPWIVVEGADPCYRFLTVGNTLLEAMRKRLDSPAGSRPPAPRAPPIVGPIDKRDVLNQVDLSKAISDKVYRAELSAWQGRLNRLSRDARFSRLSVIAAFEGMDAAGKGSTIRRVTSGLDARLYHVIPVAAPTDEERAQPYLWRFWRHLPRKGRFTIYDRTWYGRVLVERIEGFCTEADWARAYGEINDFEEQLVRDDTVLCKFWMQISEDEQLRRFKERERVPFKHFKITEEDWRNREKWDLYQSAAARMIEHTSSSVAPWTLIESNDKKFARIKVLKTICKRVECALERL
jgi:polyphosphate:AMP phosphotransferase